jgi:hypothetical protein
MMVWSSRAEDERKRWEIILFDTSVVRQQQDECGRILLKLIFKKWVLTCELNWLMSVSGRCGCNSTRAQQDDATAHSNAAELNR